MQPFLSSRCYNTRLISDVNVCYEQDHVVIRSESPLHVVGSSLWGGGLQERVTALVNGKVPLEYICDHPLADMEKRLLGWGYDTDKTVGMLTAAPLQQASVHEDAGEDYRLMVCTTAGTSNGARAGKFYPTSQEITSGTINIFVVIDGNLTEAAAINCILTATEAKAAALQDLDIRDRDGDVITGTTTDSIVVASANISNSSSFVHHFAGVATSLGNALGRCVYASVVETLSGKDRIL